MSIFKNGIFIKSVDKMENRPEKYLNEVLFVGKSNVGKSTLINLLVNNKKLAYTSSKPGHTKLLNYYLINNSFYFVDCPGYGFSSKKGKDYIEYGKIVEDYFNNNENLKLIVFLLDSRHEPTEDDVDFFNFINRVNAIISNICIRRIIIFFNISIEKEREFCFHSLEEDF